MSKINFRDHPLFVASTAVAGTLILCVTVGLSFHNLVVDSKDATIEVLEKKKTELENKVAPLTNNGHKKNIFEYESPDKKLIEEEKRTFKFLYEDFFKEGGTIILSNPPVYKYLNKGDREALESHLKSPLSEAKQEVFRKFGILAIGYKKAVGNAKFDYVIESKDQYTGIGEAKGLQQLTKFFFDHRIHLIRISQSRFGYPEENAIILGEWISNAISTESITKDKKYFQNWKIPYRTHDGAIYLHGKKEFPQFLNIKENCLDVEDDYAIITKAVNPFNSSKSIIICAGINSQGTEAACMVISKANSIRELMREIKKDLGSIPKWFQTVIKVKVIDGRPTEDWSFVDAKVIEKVE